MYLFLFLGLFFLLFFLSRMLSSHISLFLYAITRSHTFAIQVLAILFLPGVIIHELAHWVMASIFFVPTGEIEFFPQVHGESVKLGSVQVGKTDPVRRFLIGIAPIIAGMGVILAMYWFFKPEFFPLSIKSLVFFYGLFEIGNTMFSSRKDLEGAVLFIILLAFSLVCLVFFQVPLVSLIEAFVSKPLVQVFFYQLSIFLCITIALDALCLLLLGSFTRLLRH